jgi:P4 family phage/plasmid primase-like protien
MTSNSNIKNIKHKIDELLNEFRTTKSGGEFTHVSMGGITFPGKFNIDTQKKRDKLSKYLAIAYEKGFNFSIAEKLQKYAPIMVDIDLRLPIDATVDRLYDNTMINTIVAKYRNSINKYLKVSANQLNCFIFEKENKGEKNGELSDGIHMIFPYIVASDTIRHIIFKTVYDEVMEEELFIQFTNNSEVLDNKIVSTNPWLIYGCCKPSGIPYKLTQILGENTQIDIETIGTSHDIIKLLSLRDSKWCESNATILNQDIEINYESTSSNDDEKLNIMLDDTLPFDKLELIEKSITLVEMLKKRRADNFHEWIRVGWSLHNTHKSLFDTWVQFSKISKKYVQGECDKLWKNMKNDGYTIRSLMLWAKEDNPEAYKKFIQDDFDNNLKKNSIDNSFMIAKALYSKYFDRFVCANPKDNLWYHFSEHRWHKCPGGGKLVLLMSSDFANQYILKGQEFGKKALESNDDKKHLLQQQEYFNKIAACLMDINFKKKMMEEAKNIFHDDMFIKRLDENPNLIGFENGVYDLSQKIFRNGHPDDHISFSTNVHYMKWNDKNPYAAQINDFFEKILPNKNVRDYFLSRLSTCVSGENREEKFYFCTGSGSNGKSLCFQLVSEALGDYYISCPVTIITRKRGASSAASPELARMKGPRIGVYQEPGNDEELNIGIFKELSGNDKFMTRALYQEPIEVKPQLKSFMTMNEKPKITSDDGGTWRRLRVIEFNSKFVENPDPTNPNEFMLDDSLKSKISQWAGAFASYLIHIYNTKYDVPDKVPEPEEVQCATNEYRKEQDFVREYYNIYIEVLDDKVAENKKQTIKKKDLYIHFKTWFLAIHQGDTLPKCKKLNDFMDKEIKYKYGANGWPYLRFREDIKDDSKNDDDEEPSFSQNKSAMKVKKHDLDL